jgi:hypothetical protein
MSTTIVGAGVVIMVGTTHGCGTPDGDGTILTTIRGDGDGTTHGDTIAGAGTLVGAGPETLAGDGVTHTTVGAGEDIGTVPTTEEYIMEEIMLICPEEEVMLLVFQEQLYHPEQMDTPAEYETTADVPMRPYPVATTI